ncbi:MAG: transposase [Sporolactobacillus sp.]
MFPVLDPVYTAGLIAEIGQIDRSNNETQLAQYAGFYWKIPQSGNFWPSAPRERIPVMNIFAIT